MSQKETKCITEIVVDIVDTINRFDLLLDKYELHKALGILSSTNTLNQQVL